MFNHLHKNITVPGAEISPLEYGLKAQHLGGLLIMENFDLFNQPPLPSSKPVLIQDHVKALFDYKDGYLIRLKKINGANIGDIAGSITQNRYQVSINGKIYKLHRVIFLWHKGYMPEVIDHIDNNPLNNRIENLREASVQQNTWNTTSHKNASSKYLGVYIMNGKYIKAQIRLNGKSKYLGTFNSEEEAALAYNKVAIKHRGEFANLNIITYDENLQNKNHPL